MDFDYHHWYRKKYQHKRNIEKTGQKQKRTNTTQDSCLGSLQSREFCVFAKTSKKTKKTIFRDSWLSPPIHKTSVFFCFLEVWLVFPKTKTSGKLFSLFLLFFLNNLEFVFVLVFQSKYPQIHCCVLLCLAWCWYPIFTRANIASCAASDITLFSWVCIMPTCIFVDLFC